jgi:hypothetical protein
MPPVVANVSSPFCALTVVAATEPVPDAVVSPVRAVMPEPPEPVTVSTPPEDEHITPLEHDADVRAEPEHVTASVDETVEHDSPVPELVTLDTLALSASIAPWTELELTSGVTVSE